MIDLSQSCKASRAHTALMTGVGILCLIAVAPFAAAGDDPGGVVYYVRSEGVPGQDGLSWSTAFQTVQEALAAAEYGDRIWVARGVHSPGATPTSTFRLTDGVGLHGGFAGGETSLDQADPQANPTFLLGMRDGQPPPDTGDIAIQYAPNLVEFQVSTPIAITLENLTSETIDLAGVGFSFQYDTEQITLESFEWFLPDDPNCFFVDSSISNPAWVSFACPGVVPPSIPPGGRLMVAVLDLRIVPWADPTGIQTNPLVLDGDGTQRTTSPASQNAAIKPFNLDGNDCDGHIDRVVIADRVGPDTLLSGFWIRSGCSSDQVGEGGAGLQIKSSDFTVRDCRIVENTTNANHATNMPGRSGAGISITDSAVAFVNCDVAGNFASIGLHANEPGRSGGGMNVVNSDVTLIGCTLRGNRAGRGASDFEPGSGGHGGAINAQQSMLDIRECVFSDNRAGHGGGSGDLSSYGADGGGGGAIHADAMSTYDIRESWFVGNEAGDGGPGGFDPPNGGDGGHGGAVQGGSGSIVNCTFTGNQAGTGAPGGHDGAGGAVFTVTVLQNCIVWDNQPVGGGGLHAVYSLVEGGEPGEGNIDADPLFEGDGVSISGDSPCVDAGDPDTVFEAGERDLLGQARVVCGRVDMGAVEFQGTSGVPGDFDCTGVVDLFDFDAFLDCTTGPGGGPFTPGCQVFDVDGDEDVDFADFREVQRYHAP